MRRRECARQCVPPQVPDLVERRGLGAGLSANQAREVHADDLAICFLRQVEHLGMDVDHVGVLLRVAAVVQVDAQ